MPALQVVTESLGGSRLATQGMAGALPAWFPPRPSGAGWVERAAGGVATDWATALAPALSETGAVPARLAAVAAAGGFVVTTGQQPGLFGGPLYTLAKALTALELADALSVATGRPVAPVFWAATDDADFAEATRVWCRTPSGAMELRPVQDGSEGIPMSEVPLTGLDDAMARLLEACGGAVDPDIPRLVYTAYHEGATVGGAYVTLLRGVLEPLGIAVLDASHAAVRAAARPALLDALRQADAINDALRAREGAIAAGGMEPQVGAMPDLSLVFTRVAGKKVRIPVSEASAVAATGAAWLSPNVLLRPAVERRLLPTVAYVAGPGEFAYFAQVSAVAEALGWSVPLAVPRWSGTVIEPSVAGLLARCGLSWRDLADAHRAERAVALAATPPAVMEALQAMRRSVDTTAGAVRDAVLGANAPLDPRVIDGTIRGMTWRVDRLERRLLAGVKRRQEVQLRDIATAGGALFPGGKRQERALTFVPLLATHGGEVVAAMRAAARVHAQALVHGRPLPVDG